MAGAAERAIDWLTLAVDRGYIDYPFLARHDPCLERVRSQPRFRQLMEIVRERGRASKPNAQPACRGCLGSTLGTESLNAGLLRLPPRGAFQAARRECYGQKPVVFEKNVFP
jgi:hypothetical protein